jgi:hypothetical protein
MVFVGEDEPADIGNERCDQKALSEHMRSIGELGCEP